MYKVKYNIWIKLIMFLLIIHHSVTHWKFSRRSHFFSKSSFLFYMSSKLWNKYIFEGIEEWAICRSGSCWAESKNYRRSLYTVFIVLPFYLCHSVVSSVCCCGWKTVPIWKAGKNCLAISSDYYHGYPKTVNF